MLSLEQLMDRAPSVFTKNPSPTVSDRYRYFSTFDVVRKLQEIGFDVSDAKQTKVRTPEKKEFTKHLLRLRPTEDHGRLKVGEVTPEVVLVNAHDGTSAYRVHAGIFRLICSNGLIIADTSIAQVAIKHTGDEDLMEQVVQASVKVADTLPGLIKRVNSWRGKDLSWDQQMEFARRAAAVSPTSLELDPEELLLFRRKEDRWSPDRTRDLWRTINVVQENLMRGGVNAKDAEGKHRQTRSIHAVDRVIDTNKALWAVAEEFAL